MNRCILPRHLLALLFSMLACAGASAQWVQINSPNFNVVTDAGEKKGREVALRFEQMRLVFTMLIPREKLNLRAPVQIIAFKDRQGMRTVAPLFNGQPVEEAGLFQPGDDKNFIALDVSSENGWALVFHEYAHVLLNSALPPMPLWFDEGFAEYYSTTKIDSKGIRVGDPPPFAVQLLGDGLMPSAQLLSIHHGSPEYNESGERRSLFYAQSWLMVYWLIGQHKLGEASQYMQFTQVDHLPPAEAAQKAFGMSLAELDKTLAEYFKSGRVVNTVLSLPPGMESVTYPATKLKDFESTAILADLHLHTKDHLEEARQEFETVLQRKPDTADAYRGLGYYYLRKNDLTKAGENFHRAAVLGSNDPRVYYYAAYAIEQKTQGSKPDPEDLVEMNANLDQAIKIDPTYAEAYNLKAHTLEQSRNVTEAIRLIKIAAQLSPRNQYYLSTLAGYYMEDRRFDEALALLAELTASDDPTLAASAKRQMQTAKEWKASPLAQLAAQNAAESANNKWGPKNGEQADDGSQGTAQPEPDQPEAADKRPIKFLKGTLTSATCSPGPGAVLTVLSAKKSYKLRVRDMKKLVLVGQENFSCSARNYSVSVNYRSSGPATGDVVSVEIE